MSWKSQKTDSNPDCTIEHIEQLKKEMSLQYGCKFSREVNLILKYIDQGNGYKHLITSELILRMRKEVDYIIEESIHQTVLDWCWLWFL